MDEVRGQDLILHRPIIPDEAECVTAVKVLNDAYTEFASRYPDRISSYAMLPLQHIDAALKEMERRFDQLGCVGVNMNIVCLSRSIPEPSSSRSTPR
jgi:predicted TIM-barrel fold metal-dependent hydrolase